ncbi:hypothetical protein JP39_08005 [Companilactobacillus heilongjiangensis]|uniref:Uncharacterized protein n=1 Tax=Companilactobacillus heilongjiangensis TaxID=1074467 RepID=A0A0K2LDG2_9LACO|nr:hypothetical protein JP39_08005 [Companilactobacillus heilongjiangensis]
MKFSSGSGVRTLVLTPLRLLRFANLAKLKIEARDARLAPVHSELHPFRPSATYFNTKKGTKVFTPLFLN